MPLHKSELIFKTFTSPVTVEGQQGEAVGDHFSI